MARHDVPHRNARHLTSECVSYHNGLRHDVLALLDRISQQLAGSCQSQLTSSIKVGKIGPFIVPRRVIIASDMEIVAGHLSRPLPPRSTPKRYTRQTGSSARSVTLEPL